MTAADPLGPTIRRGHMRADRFVQVSNDLARDGRLSRRARGLFLELASHREGWQTSLAGLVEGGPEGAYALRVAIGELEMYGYLERVQVRDTATGRVTGAEYWITDCPKGYSPSSEPSCENPTTAREEHHPSSGPLCDFPPSGDPQAGDPTAGDRTHKKTNSKKTNSKKTNEKIAGSFATAQGPAEPGRSKEPPSQDKPPRPAAKGGTRKQRTPQEQERFEQADTIATKWWALCEERRIPNIRRGTSTAFAGFRAMLERALAADCTDAEIKWALEDLRDPFPSSARFQQAIARRRGVAPPPLHGRSRPVGNRHLQAVSGDDEQAQRRRDMFG